MPEPLLLTKLYVPPPRPNIVLRSRLINQLNAGRHGKLTLISAPAGFGKTTLVSEWLAACGRCEPKVGIAWLSLDEGDNDPARFLTYLVAALQPFAPEVGAGLLGALQVPQPPPIESILIALLNEITNVSGSSILVLDDYQVIDSQVIDEALTFFLNHLPPQLHLVITTREDPRLPLARFRARGQLSELRAADLRFTPHEAAAFLEQSMGLDLSAEDIAALETRTEGWIAGLQLAALALQGLAIQGNPDTVSFIKSFTGSHHFVLDYLMEEVLQQQPEHIQTFLLRTSILDRLCGPLCEAVVDSPSASGDATSGQQTLEYLERANLFIVPLDDKRHWYRYHHLFVELLRQRLHLRASAEKSTDDVAQYHIRASQWHEANQLVVEAFQHAAAANDIERAERLMESKEMSARIHTVLNPVRDWLASLPQEMLDARPLLRIRSATLSLMAGQTSGVAEKLQAAEAALVVVAPTDAAQQNGEPEGRYRDLVGQIAAARATLALTHYDAEAMILQAQRALAYLPPENLAFRFTANWVLANALMLQGQRAAAARACQESVALSHESGHVFSKILASFALGEMQELDNQLHQAAETYQLVLELSGEHLQPNAGEVHLGLARIHYEWNDLEAAEQHGQHSLLLSRQYDRRIDRFILSEVFLARLKLAQGDIVGAEEMLAQTQKTAQQKGFSLRLPEIATVQVLALLRRGHLDAAAQLAQQYERPLSLARVLIAHKDTAAALAVLEPLRQQAEARGWADERLKAIVLQALALHVSGEVVRAVHVLGEALALAEPGGFIRLFVDEGPAMAELLSAAAAQGVRPGYIQQLLAAFDVGKQDERSASSVLGPPSLGAPGDQTANPTLVDPLSPRELEVLRLIAEGLSNQEISERLFLALDTVKGHNRRIFEKLQVKRRTEAIARARALGLL